MSTLIPNENCWIGFAEDFPADADGLVPTAAEVADAIELTDFIISFTANAQGNAVPTPKLKSMFETSIPGTNTATLTAECYRDSVRADDLAWNTLPRNAYGVFYVSRFGGTGPELLPIATDHVETWPARVISRAASPMSSNTAQTFTMTGSVPQEPNEDAIVAA
jgi:hypothetical protein